MRIVNYIPVPRNSDLWHNVWWCQTGLLSLVAFSFQMAIISHYKLKSFEKYTYKVKAGFLFLTLAAGCHLLECLTCFFKNVIYLEEIFLWHFVSPQAISESIALEMVVNEDRWRSQPPGYCFHFSIRAFASRSEERQRHSLLTAGSLFCFPRFFLNGKRKKMCFYNYICCRNFKGQY